MLRVALLICTVGTLVGCGRAGPKAGQAVEKAVINGERQAGKAATKSANGGEEGFGKKAAETAVAFGYQYAKDKADDSKRKK